MAGKNKVYIFPGEKVWYRKEENSEKPEKPVLCIFKPVISNDHELRHK